MRIPPKLLLLFIAVPVIEVYLFIKIGGAIGLAATLGIIVVTAVLGAMLTRAQGARAIERFQSAALSGKSPRTEVVDGIFILVAGIFLITPGFFTDVVGFLLLAPPVRNAIKSRVAAAVTKRFTGQFQQFQFQQPVRSTSASQQQGRRRRSKSRQKSGKVIDAEIIDE